MLKLARDCEFARKLVNSGRLSVPAVLADSPLNTPDRNGDAFAGAMRPARGGRCVRARGAAGPQRLHRAAGCRALGALDGCAAGAVLVVPAGHAQAVAGVVVVEDVDGFAAQRYDAKPGTFYLLRPDQHVRARARSTVRRWPTHWRARPAHAENDKDTGDSVMPPLDTRPRLADPDAFYEALIDMHRDRPTPTASSSTRS